MKSVHKLMDNLHRLLLKGEIIGLYHLFNICVVLILRPNVDQYLKLKIQAIFSLNGLNE